MTNYNFQSLKAQIRGKEFELAKAHAGLTGGRGQKHYQACPKCSGGNEDAPFFFRQGRALFECRRCKFSGDIFDLTSEVRGTTRERAFDVIATAVGYGKSEGISSDGIISENAAEQLDTAPALGVDEVFDLTFELPMSESDSAVPTSEKNSIDVLDSLLERVEQISFKGSPDHVTYYVNSIEHLLKTVKEYGLDFGFRNGIPYFFTGEFWKLIEPKTFRHFLQATGTRQSIPRLVIKDHQFAGKLEKQFASEAKFPASANNVPKINLCNGTLHVTPDGTELKPFDKGDGLTYQLHYNYDESATAPLFKKFLDRVLPDDALQKLLFQYVGYVFLRDMKLDKILFLYGGGANGKSVFLNIIRGLIGNEQCCEYSLEDLANVSSTRAELGRHLLNICTEISSRMKTDIFKIIASREPLSVNPKYKDPYTLHDYATSIFSMNELPKNVEMTDGYFRRFIIVPFDVRIPDDEQDPDLARKIINSEMSGVLNYVVDGVKSLFGGGGICHII